VQAYVGLALILFLPSLFAWSISALKESLFFCLSALSIVLAVRIPRERSWVSRILIGMLIATLAAALQTIREGGLAITALGVAGGLAGGILLLKPRLAIAAALIAPIAIAVVWSRAPVQVSAWNAVKDAARVHWGHIATSGGVYKALDPRFYSDRSSIESLRGDEGLRFIVRAFVHYVAEPVPWNVRSRAAAAFMPEQMVWYLLVLCLPIGIVVGLKRAPLFASLLTVYGLTAVLIVALTSGNIGTLVRHRGLALPYLVWLSAVGAARVVVWIARRSQRFGSHGSRAVRGGSPSEYPCPS
jgi:hypothetical protein